MNYSGRPDEEDLILDAITPHLELLLIKWKQLAFQSHLLPYQLRPHMRLNNMTASHVPHSEHQTELTITLTDHCIPTEQKSLGSFLRTGQFGEYNAHHERLDHHPTDALEAEDEDCFWTFFGHLLSTVPDSVLRLNAEQEARGKGMDIVDTRSER
uniref:Uncharacterized protein n=1 Tax=Cacopsylla melanoneura TaxID=428564 RepID=A0A8D8R026_9HEMI